MNLATVREALARTIQNGILERANVFAYPVAAPHTPAVIVEPADDYLTYHQNFKASGVEVIRFQLNMYVQGLEAHRLLDELVSFGDDAPNSIPNALRADPKLGNSVSRVHCRAVTSGPALWNTGATIGLLVDVYP